MLSLKALRISMLETFRASTIPETLRDFFVTQSRRNFLTLGVVIAGGYAALRYGAPAVSNLFAKDFEFEPVANPVGFRRITGGESTAGFDPFFGLGEGPDQEMQAIIAQVESRICETLYGELAEKTDIVPLASFSDYNCPFCRVLTQRLSKMEEASGGRLRIAWHELPLLGEASIVAAKGALAAKRQGAYVAFHKRLMRAPFQTTPEYLAVLAASIGVDEEQLIADMKSESVQRELRESGALAQIFGFIGTPALVVGRTVVQGEIGESTLMRLIEKERADGPVLACA